jgi:hypothetical protein
MGECYGPDDRGIEVRFLIGASEFSVLHSVWKLPYLTGTGDNVSGCKKAGA